MQTLLGLGSASLLMTVFLSSWYRDSSFHMEFCVLFSGGKKREVRVPFLLFCLSSAFSSSLSVCQMDIFGVTCSEPPFSSLPGIHLLTSVSALS